jgi:hypothetical protein
MRNDLAQPRLCRWVTECYRETKALHSTNVDLVSSPLRVRYSGRRGAPARRRPPDLFRELTGLDRVGSPRESRLKLIRIYRRQRSNNSWT